MRTQRDFFDYVGDSGKTYRLFQDKSNGLAAGNTLNSDSSNTDYPRRWEPRYANAEFIARPSTANATVPVRVFRRKIYIGSITNAIWVSGGTIVLNLELPDNNYVGVTLGPDNLARATFDITGLVGEYREDPVT